VDRTILPATAGEDASAAAGVAVVRVRERNPEHNPGRNPEARPKMLQHSPIKTSRKLLREAM
jgi:hypothetical protein